MAIHVVCPKGHPLRVADKYAGRRGRCPKCGAVVVIPRPDEPVSEPDHGQAAGDNPPIVRSQAAKHRQGDTDRKRLRGHIERRGKTANGSLAHAWLSAARRERKAVASDLAVLIGANLVPLGGVAFFGWDAFTVVLLYWLENVIVVFRATNQVDRRTGLSFGMFTLIQGIFVIGMLGPLSRHPERVSVHPDGGFSFNPPPGAAIAALADAMSFSLLVAILALVGEHAYASRQQGKSGHHVFAGGAELFVRIVPLHLAIIFGSMWMVVYKLSDAVVVVLVAVKIVVEVVGYLWQSRLSRAREE